MLCPPGSCRASYLTSPIFPPIFWLKIGAGRKITNGTSKNRRENSAPKSAACLARSLVEHACVRMKTIFSHMSKDDAECLQTLGLLVFTVQAVMHFSATQAGVSTVLGHGPLFGSEECCRDYLGRTGSHVDFQPALNADSTSSSSVYYVYISRPGTLIRTSPTSLVRLAPHLPRRLPRGHGPDPHVDCKARAGTQGQ